MLGAGGACKSAGVSNTDETTWSGARAPPTNSDWFDGKGFWLNRVLGEELDEEDPRLTLAERAGFESIEGEARSSGLACFELPFTDERSSVPQSANNASLRLASLNHDPDKLRSVFFTTFDLVDDVAWLREELRLPSEIPFTLCAHCWPEHTEEREQMFADIHSQFSDAVVHFPRSAIDEHSLNTGAINPAQEADEVFCSVHSKLFLLEFSDRLRVAVATANLTRTSWQFRGEAVWVQDFPLARCPGDEEDASEHASSLHGGTDQELSTPDVRYLLKRGSFARVLAHVVADVLRDAPSERQRSWIRCLAKFDYSDAAARLIPSRPSFCSRASMTRSGDLSVRLRLISSRKVTVDDSTNSAYLHRNESGAWDVCSYSTSGGGCDISYGSLDINSSAALFAAEELGFRWQGVVEILPSSVPQVWQQVSIDETDANTSDADEMCSYVVRLILDGTCAGGWTDTDNISALLLCTEVNYGLFALEEHLDGEAWPQADERNYAAITGSVGWLDEAWLNDFDRLLKRATPEGPSGPSVVTPGGDVGLPAGYVQVNSIGRLCNHEQPWHSPGRERIPNHSKMIVRQFWDSGRNMPYGWVYVGSHNLTVAAWGTLVDDGCFDDSANACSTDGGASCREKLWVSNRELGVLLMQPSCTTSLTPPLFASVPLPFGMPASPADIEGRHVIDYGDPTAPDADDELGWSTVYDPDKSYGYGWQCGFEGGGSAWSAADGPVADVCAVDAQAQSWSEKYAWWESNASYKGDWRADSSWASWKNGWKPGCQWQADDGDPAVPWQWTGHAGTRQELDAAPTQLPQGCLQAVPLDSSRPSPHESGCGSTSPTRGDEDQATRDEALRLLAEPWWWRLHIP